MPDKKRLITISMDNRQLRRDLAELTGRGLQRNVTNVVNRLAFDGRAALVGEMKRVFKHPKPFTLNAFKVIKAKPGKSEAALATRDLVAGQNIGTAAARYLSPDVFGDERGMKPSEHALSKVSGNQYWVPGNDAPLDGNGNIKPSEIKAMLAQLSLYDNPAQNLSDKRAARMQKGTKKRGPQNANGQRGQYFVARSRTSGRPFGIYKYSGTPGRVLQIIRFVATPPHYRKILPAQKVVDTVVEKNARRYVEEEIAIRLQRKLAGKK